MAMLEATEYFQKVGMPQKIDELLKKILEQQPDPAKIWESIGQIAREKDPAQGNDTPSSPWSPGPLHAGEFQALLTKGDPNAHELLENVINMVEPNFWSRVYGSDQAADLVFEKLGAKKVLCVLCPATQPLPPAASPTFHSFPSLIFPVQCHPPPPPTSPLFKNNALLCQNSGRGCCSTF